MVGNEIDVLYDNNLSNFILVVDLRDFDLQEIELLVLSL